jgi:hypothetical protein
MRQMGGTQQGQPVATPASTSQYDIVPQAEQRYAMPWQTLLTGEEEGQPTQGGGGGGNSNEIELKPKAEAHATSEEAVQIDKSKQS